MDQTTEPHDRTDSYRIIDDYARDRVSYHAARAARIARLTATEREDLEQNLLLALCKAAPRFDPAVASSHTFVSHVVRLAAMHELRTIRRARRCRVRGACPMSVLDAAVTGSIECPRSSDEARHDLRTDVAAAVARLPDRSRAVAHLLMRSTRSQAARALGISRQSVHAHVVTIRSGAAGSLLRSAC